MKKFIKNTYGSGTQANFLSAVAVPLIGITFSAILIFHVENPENVLPTVVNDIFRFYVAGVVSSFSFLFFALYFYCKPIPPKDTFKYFKILFLFITIFFSGIFLLPYAIFDTVTSFTSKKLRIQSLFENLTDGLLCIIVWLILLYAFLCIFSCILLLFISFLGLTAILSYSMFFSLLISNKLAKILYFHLIKANSPEKIKRTQHELNILWACMVLLVSFFLEPLNFNNENIECFCDALFYSVATLSLFSDLIQLQKEH